MTGEFECSRAVATNRSTSSRSTGGEAAIYGSLWKSVRVYVWRWYCDWDLAEEIASDVVARLWERREKHHPNTLEWRFVVSCIRNAVRDHWKAETRERERRARADSPSFRDAARRLRGSGMLALRGSGHRQTAGARPCNISCR